MKYLLNNIEIDSNPYISDIEKGFTLTVLRQFVDSTGASLFEAKELYDRIIKEEKININPTALEIQAYCKAELNDIE